MMARNRKHQWERSLTGNCLATILVFWVLLLGGCTSEKGATSAGDGAEAGSQFVVQALSGMDQSTAPRSRFADPVKFLVTDRKGTPLEGLATSFYLIDVSSATQADPATIVEAVKNDQLSLTSEGSHLKASEVDSAVREQLVGRVDNPNASTNGSGVSEAVIVAPDAFSREIALVVKVSGGESLGDNWAVVRLHTPTIGANKEGLRLQSSNGGLERAGESFDLSLSVERDGNVVRSFDAILDVTLQVKAPENAEPNSIPTSFKCVFFGGFCVLPGGPYTLKTAGAYQISVTLKGAELTPTTLDVSVQQGIPVGLRLSTVPMDKGFKPICADTSVLDDEKAPCYTLNADQSFVKLYPILVDKGGNPLGPTQSEWTVTGALQDRISTKNPPAEQTLMPFKSGSGKISVNIPNHPEFGLVVAYKVDAGTPSAFGLTSSGDLKEVATVPFGAEVTLFDQRGNLCDNYSESMALKFELNGANASVGGIAAQSQLSDVVSFKAGKGSSSKLLLAPNSSDTPTIKVTGDIGTLESGKITLSAGSVVKVKLRSAAAGGGTEVVDKDPSAAPIYTGQLRPFFVAGYDANGNYSADEVATFVGTGVFENLAQPAQGTATAVTPVTVGSGTIVATPLNTALTAVVTPVIQVYTSPAAKFRLESEHDNVETTGTPFTMRVVAENPQGGIAVSFDGQKNLVFVTTSGKSWEGLAPQLPSGIVVCNFTGGVCNLPGTYTVADPTNVALVNVADFDKNVPGVWGSFIVARVGPAQRVVFADKVGGPSAGAKVLASAIKMTADETFSFAAALVDGSGNFVSDAAPSAVWSSTGPVIQPNLSTWNGASSLFTPGVTGSATLTVTQNGLTGNSPLVTVAPGVLHHVETVTQHAGVEKPGDCFTFSINLKDQRSNTLTNVDLVTFVTLAVINGESGNLVLRAPSFSDAGSGSAVTYDPNPVVPLTFTAGSAISTKSACLYDATSVAPQIQLSLPSTSFFPAFRGAGAVIQISVGTPYAIAFANQQAWTGQFVGEAYGDNNLRSYAPYYVPGVIGGLRSINVTFDADKGARTLYAQLMDKGGNYLASPLGNWSSSDAVVNNPAPTPPLVAQMSNVSNSNSVTLTNTYATYGMARLTFLPTDPSLAGISGIMEVNVKPGLPVIGKIHVNADAAVNATVPFATSVDFFDQFGNVTSMPVPSGVPGSFRINFSLAGANSSRKGTAPTKVSYLDIPYVDYDSFGATPKSSFRWTTATGFLFPNASDVITLSASSTYTRAAAGGVPAFNPNFSLVVSKAQRNLYPGDATSVVFTSAGQALDPALTTLTVNADQQPSLYVTGWDDEQNFVALQSSTFTTTGIATGTSMSYTAPRLSVTVGTSTIFYPGWVGTGTIKATPADPALAAITLPVTVTYGALYDFLVATEHGGTETAGVPFSMRVTAVDRQGNTVQTFDGPQYLSWAIPGGASTLTAPDKSANSIPSNGSYTFNQGVLVPGSAMATFYVALPNSGAGQDVYIRVSHNPVGGGNTIASETNNPLVVTSGPMHHYSISPAGADPSRNYWATSDFSFAFYCSIDSLDQWGNQASSDWDSTVTLAIVKEDGSATNGTLLGAGVLTLNPTSHGANCPTLKFDVEGRHRLRVTSARYSSAYHPVGAAVDPEPVIDFKADERTVNHYSLSFASPAVAGTTHYIIVTALDNHNNKIVGADAALAGLTYTWGGVHNASGSPDGNLAPVMPTSSPLVSFGAGSATVGVTFKKSETISAGNLTFSDNQASPKSGSSTIALVVNPSVLDQYVVSSNQSSRIGDSTSLFDLTITAYDQFRNVRSGDGNLILTPVRVSGAAKVGTITDRWGGTLPALNLVPGTLTLTNLYYNAGNTITFGLTNSTAANTANPVVSSQIAFSQSTNYILYKLVVPTTVVAGQYYDLTLNATDGGGNNLQGFDTYLNTQTYTWSGPGTSPWGNAPIYDSAPLFFNGAASIRHQFFRAETLTALLKVQDNYYSGPQTPHPRVGIVMDPSTVVAGTASTFDLTASTTSVTAGQGFDVSVVAADSYGNADKTFVSDTLTFEWSGTTPTHIGSTTPVVKNSGVRTFNNGVYTTFTHPFILYNKWDAAPVLTVTGTTFSDFLGGWIVNSVSPASSVKIHSTAASNTPMSLELGNYALTADNTLALYAHSYDLYGNYGQLTSVTWTASGNLSGRLSSSSGTSTTVSPRLVGTGVVTATPSGSLTADSTGTITTNPGAITKVVFKNSALSQLTDNCGTLQVETQDQWGNAAPVGSNTTINLSSSTGHGTFYSNSNCTGAITNFVLTTNTSTRTLYFQNTLPETTTLSATESPSSGWTAASQTAITSVGVITKVAFTSAANTLNATVCGSFSFQVQDQYSNASTVTNQTFSLTSSVGTTLFYSDAACTSAVTSKMVTGSGATLYFKGSAAAAPTFTIAASSPSQTWTNATQVQTINPGQFTITQPTTPSTNRTPTISWGAAVGSSTYSFLVDNNNDCVGGVQSYTVNGTSQALASLADGVYYLCVTAQANGATNRNADNQALAFTVDGTAPTQPSGLYSSVANGGSATNYVNSVNFYHGWTASTDATSGLANYTLEKFNNGTCNGSAASTTTVTGTTVATTGTHAASYSFRLTARDNTNNTSAVSNCSPNVMVDTVNPSAPANPRIAADASNGPTATYDDDTTVYFVWDAGTDADSGVGSYTVNYWDGASCTGTQGTLSGIPNAYTSFTGSHAKTYSFKVATVDRAGNLSAFTGCSGSIYIDTTFPSAPTGLITAADSSSGPDVRFDDDLNEIYFRWTPGTDSDSGLQKHRLTYYNAASCPTSGATATVVDNVNSGYYMLANPVLGTTYSFKVESIDNSGNATPSACSGSIMADNVAPAAPTSLKTAQDASTDPDSRYDNDFNIFLVWTAPTEANSGIRDYTLVYYDQAACTGNATTVTGITATNKQITIVAGTTYSFKVMAYDNAGNAGNYSGCSGSMQYDAVAPTSASSLITAAGSSGTSDVRYSTSTGYNLLWTAGSDAFSGIRDYTVKLYSQAACGGTATDSTGVTATSKSFTGTNGTVYSFMVVTYDNAGNSVTSSCSLDIRIDTGVATAATGLITAQGASGTSDTRYSNTTAVNFKWTAAADTGGSGLRDSTLQYFSQASCGGTATSFTALAPATTSKSVTGLAEGVYSFNVIAYDNAGNSLTSACSSSITVDTTAPGVPSSPDTRADSSSGPTANIDNDTQVFFAWTDGAEAGSGFKNYTVTYYSQANCGGTGTDVTGITTPSYYTFTGTNGSIYSFKVKTQDNAGNFSSQSLCSPNITIDTTAPGAFTITAPSSLQTTSTPTVTWNNVSDASSWDLKIVSSTDCNAAAIANQSYLGLVTNSQTLTTALADGTYYACVTARDNAGNTTNATNNGSYSFQVETSVVHASFSTLSAGTYAVNYATRSGNTWTVETVDSGSDVIDADSSLALDSANKPHLSFTRAAGGLNTLKYTNRSSGSWTAPSTLDTADVNDDLGLASSIALNGSNQVFITYKFYDSAPTPVDLFRVIDNSTGSFPANGSTLTALSAANSLKDTSIALDNQATNIVHMIGTYKDSGLWKLTYRTSVNSWGSGSANEIPDNLPTANCDEYYYATIRVDSNAKPHIAYVCKKTTGDTCSVYYANKTGASWTHTYVGNVMAANCAASLGPKHRPSIALDSSNYAHVAWLDVDTSYIKYRTNSGGSWATEVSVDTTAGNQGECALTLDTYNIPYILFMQTSASVNYLKMTTKNSGAWVTESVTGASNLIGVGTSAITGVKGRSNH